MNRYLTNEDILLVDKQIMFNIINHNRTKEATTHLMQRLQLKTLTIPRAGKNAEQM